MIHAARLETLRALVSVVTARCCSLGCPQMNKFEQIASDHHQMSLTRGSTGLISREVTLPNHTKRRVSFPV